MPVTRILGHLVGFLTLTGGLLLAACGDNTPTLPPTTTAPITAATTTTVATSAASTTAAATSVSATTAVPTAAPITTVALSTAAPTAATTTAVTTAATTGGATTAPATGQAGPSGSGSGKAAELLANIPSSADYIKAISYDNYVAFRKLNNISDNATFQSLSQDKAAFTRFNNAIRTMNPAQVLSIENFQTLRDTAGYDLLQADYDLEAGLPGNQISLAQGNFDAAAIDKAWTAGGATKGKVGPNASYTFEELGFDHPLQQIFLGPAALISVPAQKLLVFSKPPTAATAVAGELPSKNPLSANPAVKALLDAFGDPLSLYMGTSLISGNVPDLTNITPGATGAANVKATFQATQPVPPPLIGGYAFYQDAAGARTYLVANYYTDAASAKAAQPILEDRLKNGKSNVNRLPYSQYWEVASSEVKGNVLLFKLNWKQLNGLNQFVFSRDFPAFLV